MHRTSRLPLVAVALLSLLAPVALSVADAQSATGAEATAVPDLRLFTLPDPDNPIRIAAFDAENPPAPGECIHNSGYHRDKSCSNVGLGISSSETLTDVTVTVIESEGLYVDPMVTTYDTIEGTGSSELVRFAVRATTTGLHTLTLEVTAPGAETRTITLPYLWRSGGAPLPGGDSLARRLYGQNFRGSYPCAPNGDCDFRYAERMVFMDDKRTSPALAVNGEPACGPGGKCPKYRYDTSTGLFQVGRFIIGRVTTNATYVDGARYERMTYPKRGQRLDRTWVGGDDVDEGRGVVYQDLELRPNGHFKLSYSVDNHRYGEPGAELMTYARKLAGTYRIGRNGKITFTDTKRKRKKKVVATLALITNAKGRARPDSKGVWLDLKIRDRDGRKIVDGNYLNALLKTVND